MKRFNNKALLLLASMLAMPAAWADGGFLHRAAGVHATGNAPTAQVTAAAVVVPAGANLDEGFDNVSTLVGNGWFMQNNSSPLGLINTWFQGTPTTATPTPGPFNAFDGANNAYIGVNFNSTASGSSSTISNWLLTPTLNFGGNGTLSFYTRKPTIGAGMTDYPDRLEVRYSTNGASTNIGATATTVGDFTNLALSVNPTLVVGGYPQVWTQYTVTNLPHNGSGRIAFRYFVTNGGPTGANSDYIGLDRVMFSAGAPEYRVGGTVAGLTGTGLVLQLNGADDLPIASNGSFTFPSWVASGAAYAVTVATQPTSPGQTCTVGNGSGTIGNGDVSDLQVVCTNNSYLVGGSVGGLVGSGLVLQLNGTNDLPIGANGNFVFPSQVDEGAPYSVTIGTQPTSPSQTCAVGNGSGTIGSGDVTDVQVTCTTNSYTVGGSVGGLDGSGLVLQLNGGYDLAIGADGVFAFPPIDDGSVYSVTVASQPAQPTQVCEVANGTGTLAGGNVGDIAVTCVTHTYTVGGVVSGVVGSGLVLQINGAGDLAIAADGAFVFPALPDASAYVITVASQPTQPSQTCTVSNADGVLSGADVTNLLVSCATNAYSIGGTASGLTGTGLMLRLNGGSDLPVTADGAFTFAATLPSGSSYVVSLAQAPQNQACTLANASGTVIDADIIDVDVTCIAAAPVLGLSLGDGREFARYGQVVDYVVILHNSGNASATDVAIGSVLSPGWDAEQAHWTCLGGDNGAVCSPNGVGPLGDTITLPADRSLTWLVSIPVRTTAAEPTVDLQIDAAGAAQVLDSNTLVVFRDGYDVPYGDGTQGAPPQLLDGARARAILDGDASHVFVLAVAGEASGMRVERVLVLREGGREASVERIVVGETGLVRLRLRDRDGREHASAWASAPAGATLAIGSAAAAGLRSLLLEGAADPLALPIRID